MEIVKVLLRQLLQTPATNKFPAKYAPKSTIKFLDRIKRGELKLIPPIAVPPRFRGKISYNREKCTGCQLCLKVCPTKAIEFIPEEKKVKIFVARCCFCAQCNDICPVDALSMTDEFMLSSYDKYSDELVVTK
ncbi:MAG TPA: 4Fe-4S binding protein [Dehalococcoidia bacterium]|nr:4Fe-4S binding protein [Dehalococcoidia bacterium]